MKKLVVMFVAVTMAVAAFAEKGQSLVGFNLNATPSLEKGVKTTHFGIEARYLYSFTDGFRGGIDLGYDFKSKELSVFEAGINLNYVFNVSESFGIYPLIGGGYASLSVPGASKGKMYFNVGVGAEYNLTEHFAIDFEIKYQYIKDFARLPISLGVAYKF